jgi:hypothetical protein
MPSPYTHTGSLTCSPSTIYLRDLADKESSTKCRYTSLPRLGSPPVIDLGFDNEDEDDDDEDEDDEEDEDTKDNEAMMNRTDGMDLDMDLDIDSVELLQSPLRRRSCLLPELEPVDDEQERMLLQSPLRRPSCLLPELDEEVDDSMHAYSASTLQPPSSPPLSSSASLLSLPGVNADDTLFPPTFGLSPPPALALAAPPQHPPSPHKLQIPTFEPLLSHEQQQQYPQLQHQQQSPLLLVFSDPGDIPTSPSPPAEDFIELAPDLLLDASTAAAAAGTITGLAGETTTAPGGYPKLLVHKHSGTNLNLLLNLSLLEEKTTNPAELAQLAAVRKRAVVAERCARRAETRYREDGEHALCEQARAQRRRERERTKEVEMLVRLKVGRRTGAGASAVMSDANGEEKRVDGSGAGSGDMEEKRPCLGDGEQKLQQLVAKMIFRRRQSVNTNGRKAAAAPATALNGMPAGIFKSPLSQFVTTDSSSLSSSKVPGKSTCAFQSQV